MITLHFTTLDRDLYRLNVSPETTVKQIKSLLIKKIFVSKGFVNHIFWEDEELDDDKKIEDFSFIQEGKLNTDNRLTVHCSLLEHAPPESIDTTNQYRVWFSNDPTQYLPDDFKVIIEESIKCNPGNKTTLITNTPILSDETKDKLRIWSNYSNCNILDLSEIIPKNDIEKIILQIVKEELYYWTNSPFTGSCAIASDLVRLLLVNDGVYLDCDIFVSEAVPKTVTMPYGCFLRKYGEFIIPFNNDIMCFNSTKGREILGKIEMKIISNYLKMDDPSSISDADVSRIVLKHIESRATEKEQETKKYSYSDYFNYIVLTTSGPTAMFSIISNLTGSFQPQFKEWACNQFSNYVVCDAHLHKPTEKKSRWLPNSIFTYQQHDKTLLALRNKLQAINKEYMHHDVESSPSNYNSI
ncbi:MAG: glycosyltransferase family 88 protein [Legionella sp.]|nr:glycosyltransferase family 88 protein [Legionella sp.]